MTLTRRRFGQVVGSAGALGALRCADPPAAEAPVLTPQSEAAAGLLGIPAHAETLTTACDYCIVGCGYKVHRWPVDQETCGSGSVSLGVSAYAHNVVLHGGVPHHVVVIPDQDTEVVNPGGDYGGGGALARKLYNPDTRTRERLQRPSIRIGDKLHDLGWDSAIALVARLSRHAIDRHGVTAWGMKAFSYGYYENTYALTKLALSDSAVGTPCFAPHDKPCEASDTPGLDDAGLDAFSAAYEDWKAAEAILVAGVSLVEAKAVLFHDWVKAGGAKLVVVNPRHDATAAYALANGGIFLQIAPGTDAVLYNALARVILEEGWEDKEFLSQSVATLDELTAEPESAWRRHRFGRTLEDYRRWLLTSPEYEPEQAARSCGLSGAQEIIDAARLLSAPTGGTRTRTSVMFEKGNYWGFNFENTASIASLGLVLGAGNRPGRVISRAGGHQRGMLRAAAYPAAKAPAQDEFEGHQLPFNLDRWAAAGELRFLWVIGTHWLTSTAASGWLRQKVMQYTVESPHQLSTTLAFPRGQHGAPDLDYIEGVLTARMRAGHMVLTQSDIYPNALSQLSDIVLPASGWGEEWFSRMQGERRLRLYAKICDAPGEAKPDWWIIAKVAQAMGYAGFDWPDANAVFEEAAEVSRQRGANDYGALVSWARARGQRGHDALRALGTTGIQCPIREENGTLVGTVRMHEAGFKTASKKAILMVGDWQTVAPRRALLAPAGDELWITNMRTNAWQSLFDDQRIDFKERCSPENILEIHWRDAEERGIGNGDLVRIEKLALQNPDGSRRDASFEAMAVISTSVRRGLCCSYFNFRGDHSRAANNITPGAADPVNNLYGFKLASGRVVRTGRRAEVAERVSMAPRNLAFV